MGALVLADRAAGRMARHLDTLGQLALLVLGVHLAADRLDDRVHAVLTGAVQAADTWLGPPLWTLAETIGLEGDALHFWTLMPLPIASAALALTVELSAVALLAASFLLTDRRASPTFKDWRASMGLEAVVLPPTLAGVLVAGGWSLAMGLEDLLPSGLPSQLAAATVGMAAVLRYGLPAWKRAVANLDPPDRPTRGLMRVAILAPVGLLAWMHGLPLWGWLT